MKQLILILFIILISGCATKYEKSDLIGTWEVVSVTYPETGEVELPEVDFEKVVVEVRSDSLYIYQDDIIYENDAYAWEIEGDSIFV